MMPNRRRNIPIVFWVTEDEKDKILQKMAQLGIINMSAYLRKMAIDGYAVQLEIPELKEVLSLLRYSSNNLNQLTKRALQIGRVYEQDLQGLHENQQKILAAAEKILEWVSRLQ